MPSPPRRRTRRIWRRPRLGRWQLCRIAEASLVIGCDSVLDLDGSVLGKPGDAAEAVRRWREMRGRRATLVTGHCIIDTSKCTERSGVASTVVEFADLTDAEIDAYVATGEPLQVAGAFTVDGLGGPFVTRIEGDHHNVVGISLPLLRTMLADLGVTWTDLWADASRGRAATRPASRDRAR